MAEAAEKRPPTVAIDPELYDRIVPVVHEATGIEPKIKSWVNELIRKELDEMARGGAKKKRSA